MEDQKKSTIVKGLIKYQHNKELSQNELAKDVKMSAAQLINVLNDDKWSMVSEKKWNELDKRFGPKIEEWMIFATYNFKLLTTLCDDAKIYKRFLACSAASGFGKSTTLTVYADRNPEVFYVLCDITMRPKDFLRSILFAMNVNEEGTIRWMLDAVIKKLNEKKNPLLILDDFGKVQNSIYSLLQLIYDKTEGSCGIVLSGTTYLKLYIDRMASRNKLGFREFKRRIEYWLGLKEPSKKIVKEICQHHGILNEDAVSYIARHAQDYGTLKALIRNANRAAEGAVDLDIMENLQVGEKDHIAA